MFFILSDIPDDIKPAKVLSWEKIKHIKAKTVAPENISELKHIGWKMVKTCLQQGGIGLAAPQIGIFKKVILCQELEEDLNNINNNFNLTSGKKYYLYINPDFEPIHQEGKHKMVEYCLSVPKKGYEISRWKKIIVSWDELNEMGAVERQQKILEGWPARLFQHECLPRNSKISTEEGLKTIGEIVDKKWKGKVWSVNPHTKMLELKPVIGWQKKDNKQNKQWVRVKFSKSNPNNQLCCTEEHPCAVVDNILMPSDLQIDFVPAKNLTGRYVVRKPIKYKSQLPETPLYNQEQLSTIVGGLLGKLHISVCNKVIIAHNKSQFKYAFHKTTLLNGLSRCKDSNLQNKETNVIVEACGTEQTKLLRQLCYRPQKTVKHLLPFIDEIALAYWYMDVGCLIKQKYAQLCIENFSKTDVKLLQNFLLEKFLIKSKMQCKKTISGPGWRLNLDKKASERLFILIHPFILRCMEHKLPRQFQGHYYNINSTPFAFSVKKVIEVIEDFNESLLFDISVEKNSNYFADNTLVHNCDHLNGISIPQRWNMQHKTKKKKRKR